MPGRFFSSALFTEKYKFFDYHVIYLRIIGLGLPPLHFILFSNEHNYPSNLVFPGLTGAEPAGGHYFPRLPSTPGRIIPKPSPENVIELGTIGCPLFHATRPFFFFSRILCSISGRIAGDVTDP